MNALKKLYISLPVAHREEKDILESTEKMLKIAEIMFGQPLEVIAVPREGSVMTDKEKIRHVARCISAMSDADYFIGCRGLSSQLWPTLAYERDVARDFNIPCTFVDGDNIMPDIEAIMDVMRGQRERF
jgi:hypothetical protein